VIGCGTSDIQTLDQFWCVAGSVYLIHIDGQKKCKEISTRISQSAAQ
jgi:hypothetical protein